MLTVEQTTCQRTDLLTGEAGPVTDIARDFEPAGTPCAGDPRALSAPPTAAARSRKPHTLRNPYALPPPA
jgi:hypothetical protein